MSGGRRLGVCSFVLATLGIILGPSHVKSTETLQILSLVPFFDSRPGSGWDKGLELLPMGRIAKGEINQRPDILPGYQLEIIEASSDACSYSVIIKALVNFASNAIGVNGSSNVIGITGLACSSVTTKVSPLAGRAEVDLIQMSMANSPELRDGAAYPRLWRTVSSSIVFVNATLAFMDKLNWTKLSVLYDGHGSYFRITARELARKLTKNEAQTLVLDLPIDQFAGFIDSAAEQIKSNGARIVFASVTPSEAALVMCAAAGKNLTWPGYQWIFHTHNLNQFVMSDLQETVCDEAQILDAMENVILLKWQLSPDDTSKVVFSGKTIKQLQELYFQELDVLMQEEQYSQYASEFTVKDQPWSYPLYDETWALALALNQALPDLEANGFSLADYHFGNKLVTDIIERHLATVSFEGIVGRISFDVHHESLSQIKIYHVRNRSEILIGSYSKSEGLLLHNVSYSDFPDDDFEEVYLEIPAALRIILYVTAAIIFIMITILLVLTVRYHQSPIIRANSMLLNSLLFSGCYFLCVASVIQTVLLETGISQVSFALLCNLRIWCWCIAMNFILGNNLVKLGRIYRVFTHFGRTGLLLSNLSLFCYVFLLGIFPVLLLIMWAAVDPLHYEQEGTYHLDQNPPHVKYITRCACQQYAIWLAILFLYFGMMLIIMAFFAFQTRKVKHGHFKDTKKIFFFVFFLLFTLIFSTASWMILQQISQTTKHYGTVLLIIGNFAICLLCLGFLIAPKALPVLYEHSTTGKYKKATVRRTSMARIARQQSTLAKLMSTL